MRVIAVPVKSLSRAKRRLSPILSPLERAALTLAMLEDVLDATLAQPGWETWVISPDEVALEIAARRGARPVPEPRPPLSSAVRFVEEEAAAQRAGSLAVVLGDLPTITAESLSEALRTVGPVVIAPSTGGDGTNLLLRRPPRNMPARFGPESFTKHLQGAHRRGLPVAVVEASGLTFDLDTPEDVFSLAASGDRGRAAESCREMDLAARLRVPS